MIDPAHGSAVALGKRGVVILGASGSGKSSLALELMALGLTLVADDRVVLEPGDEALYAAPAPHLEGRIEVRGVGIIWAEWTARAAIVLAVDLDRAPEGRLPDRDTVMLAGQPVPVIAGKGVVPLAPAVFAILKGGLEEAT